MNNGDMLWSKLNKENLDAMKEMQKGNFDDYVNVQNQMCQFLINEGRYYDQALKTLCQSIYYQNNVIAIYKFRLGYDNYKRYCKRSDPAPRLSENIFFDIKKIKKLKKMLNFSDDELFDFISSNIPCNAVPPYANKVLIPFEAFPPEDLAGMIVSKINGKENIVETTVLQAEKKLLSCKAPLWYNETTKAMPKHADFKQNLAFVLCLFFGYLGAHWFYLGKKSKGFLYLFTLGLFGIGWIVDCVRLLLTIVVNKGDKNEQL